MKKNDKACVICGYEQLATDVLLLHGAVTSDERYASGISPIWKRCPRCGCLMSNSEKFDAEAFYQNEYTLRLDCVDSEPIIVSGQKKYSEVLADFLFTHIRNQHGKFLDIGAGKGNFLTALHQVLPELELHAVEPSQAFGQLRTLTFLKTFRQAFFSAHDYAGMQWDGISLIGVLEHVSDPGKFLQDIRSIMDDSTLLLIEVPNFRNNSGDWLVVDHLTKFTPENLDQLFSRCGFSIVDKRVTQSVPMQYLVKKGPVKKGDFSACSPVDISADDVTRFIKAILSIDTDCVFFGGNSFTNYTVHAEPDFAQRVKAIVNDNQLYQGRNYRDTDIPIISYEDYKKKYSGLPVILAMGKCYYPNVLPRLAGEKVIFM